MSFVPKAFLDTSAIFAALWSSSGGSRLILQLGQAQAVHLLICDHVLQETQAVLRRKAPERQAALPVLIVHSHITIVLPGSPPHYEQSQAWVAYAADAVILAAAWTASADYLVTLDKQHFLNNAALQAAAPFPIGTPGDFLAWYRDRFLT